MTITLKRQTLRNNEYYGTQEMFDKLYAQSMNNENFKRLYELIIDDRNIKLAYRNIKRNSGSLVPGTNGLTIDEFSTIEEEAILRTVKSRFSDYKPHKIKRIEIPKPNGKPDQLGYQQSKTD